jgi:hypothetical protein
MAAPSRNPLLVALIVVSAIALLEAVVIVLLLVTSLLRPAVTQTTVPTAVAQATQGAPATATLAAGSSVPDTLDVPAGTGPLRGKIGERVESGGYVLTVLGVYDEPDAELRNILDVNEDQRYIAAEILLENRTDESFFYGGSQFRLKDRDDFEYVGTLDYRQPGIGLGTIVPGERIRGFLSYIVPRDAAGISLIYQAPADAGYRTIYVSLDE